MMDDIGFERGGVGMRYEKTNITRQIATNGFANGDLRRRGERCMPAQISNQSCIFAGKNIVFTTANEG